MPYFNKKSYIAPYFGAKIGMGCLLKVVYLHNIIIWVGDISAMSVRGSFRFDKRVHLWYIIIVCL